MFSLGSFRHQSKIRLFNQAFKFEMCLLFWLTKGQHMDIQMLLEQNSYHISTLILLARLMGGFNHLWEEPLGR